MPRPVLLAGASLTPFGRTRHKLLDLLAQAAQGALKEAGLQDVDALYLGVMNAEEFTGEGNLAVALADRLGLGGAASSRVETASSTGAGALESAFFAVASGYLQNVLVVAGEKMTGLSTRATTRILAEVIAPSERRYGASMPALAALIARAYGRAHNLGEDQLRAVLGAVAVKNHARGALNPFAQFQKPISLEEHHAARPVAEPLGLFDCAPITDGAAAVVLSSRRGGVRLAGMGHATDSAAVTRRQGLTSFNSTRKAAAQAYAMAQVNPQEVDFAEVHDAFTMFEVIGSEDLGFFPPGQGWRAALEGRTGPEGERPINPSGGLKARGHPVGASGLAQVVEAYWLLTGQVDAARRLPREPKVALTQSIGGLGNNNLVTILVPASRPLHQPGSWQTSFSLPLMPLAPPRPEPPPGEVTGKVLACTLLHTPPEGFTAPLGLAMVRTAQGWLTLAHTDPEHQPALGSTVLLRLEGGLFRAVQVGDLAGTWLRTRSAWRRLPTSLRLWRRRLSR
ncbi:MAG: thiolase family protein [Desulfarculus sp.]|nr:thiolase family protein [Desulfarculus sp.]